MKDLVKGKRIVVTGSSSGIGWETARLLSEQGAEVLGVDLDKNFDHVEEFYRADLSDEATIDALVDVLPNGIDGLVNNAGLPPTQQASLLLKVNLIGLKHLTLQLIPKLNDGASIVNVASLAGFGWPEAVDAIKASSSLDFRNVDEFINRWRVSGQGWSQLLLLEGSADRLDDAESLDLARPWHPHELGQPRPGGHAYTGGFPEDARGAGRGGPKGHGSARNDRGHCPGHHVLVVRHDNLDQGHEHSRRWGHVIQHPVRHARPIEERVR